MNLDNKVGSVLSYSSRRRNKNYVLSNEAAPTSSRSLTSEEKKSDTLNQRSARLRRMRPQAEGTAGQRLLLVSTSIFFDIEFFFSTSICFSTSNFFAFDFLFFRLRFFFPTSYFVHLDSFSGFWLSFRFWTSHFTIWTFCPQRNAILACPNRFSIRSRSRENVFFFFGRTFHICTRPPLNLHVRLKFQSLSLSIFCIFRIMHIFWRPCKCEKYGTFSRDRI